MNSENCKNQIFNVGNDKEISIRDFAKVVIKVLTVIQLIDISYEKQFGIVMRIFKKSPKY